jgi:hypothetical protein
MESSDSVLIVVLALVGLGSTAWQFRRSRSLLDRWAGRNGYRIIDSAYRVFFRGPFSWTSSGLQTVYGVTVVDKAAASGAAGCGAAATS